jgi:carboxyl-terminal processing protease
VSTVPDRGPVTIVLPEQDPDLSGSLELLRLERPGLEAELGGPVEFAHDDPGSGRRWLLRLDEGHAGPPATAWDRDAGLIESKARDFGGLFEALNLWRAVRRQGGGSVEAADCADVEEAVSRVVDEVADTYPAFELRRLDWEKICACHAAGVCASEDPLPLLQTWLAELEDSHTWVWPGHENLPYSLRLAPGEAVLVRVPEHSSGFAAGVRRGWRLTAIDGEPVDAPHWLRRTAAPPHSHPYLAGRRLLAGPAGVSRTLTATGPDGSEVSWTDEPSPRPAGEIVSWHRLDSGAGYLRIEAWVEGAGVDEAVDAAFGELRGRCDRVVLDLRANPGGSLTLACRTRDRFLRERTELGSIRYSTGGGGLSDPSPIVGEPAEHGRRWTGSLVVLTDELTFSSSEDFLLGLQGLPHVAVVGRPSGGGSGRPRAMRLLPGWTLTISTALTYDRAGRCVEGAGIPVDVVVPDDVSSEVDAVLAAAVQRGTTMSLG